MNRVGTWVLILTVLVSPRTVVAQHEHNHGGSEQKKVAAPKIFLDKNIRIVQYQLSRLDNERLLLVERKTDDAKYAPVFSAILTRAGMSPQYREEALEALVEINKTDPVTELIASIENMKTGTRQERRNINQVAKILMSQSPETLAKKEDLLTQAMQSTNSVLRPVGYAGLTMAGKAELALSMSRNSDEATLDWLRSVNLVPNPKDRGQLRKAVVALVKNSESDDVKSRAIQSLAFIPAQAGDTFDLLAPLAANDTFRRPTIRTLLTVPNDQRSPASSAQVVKTIVDHAESLPPAQRTTDEFIDAMQLVDQLLARLPSDRSREFRNRLREITVRVVRIHTVEEEMRYDTVYFAVEAGRPVQVVLQNEDLMPHNLVITAPGALKEVAILGEQLGPSPGFEGKPYVPKMESVLFATGMVQAGTLERLTFTAPTKAGEYPFVCTFPKHWMRMYGVMVVVEDLDSWLQNPVPPKDPIGSDRAFVKSWTMAELGAKLQDGLRGRSPGIGEKLFAEATCSQCHKVKGEGGSVGPELTDAFKRWKGDSRAVLREILEPSHRIDPKFAVHVVATNDGKVHTGIVVSEDRSSVSLVSNPEDPKPLVIKRSDIDEMVKTSKSMMPKALLDRFTRDEIFEIVAFIQSLSN